MPDEWQRDEFTISTDPARLDLAAIHGFLTRSYWARGIPLETVARSIEHSLPLGLYHGERQIGFARWITDRATFAYLGRRVRARGVPRAGAGEVAHRGGGPAPRGPGAAPLGAADA